MNSKTKIPRIATCVAVATLLSSAASFGCTGEEYSEPLGEVDSSRPLATEDVGDSENEESRNIADASDGSARSVTRDAGGACRDDAGLAPIPEPTSDGRYARRIDRFSVDGMLTEDAGPFYEITEASGESDNRVELASAWTGDELYLGFRVEDDEVDVDGSTEPWRNDGIEVAIDPDGSGGSSLSGDEVKWIVTADGAVRAGAAESGDWAPADGLDAEAAASETRDGYVVELGIPSSAIGRSLRSGERLHLEVVNHDRDAGETVDLRWGEGGNRISTPSEWRWLEFAGRSCRRDEPVVRDAGADTTDAGETNPSDCTPASYEKIVVPAGETRRFRLGDGDVLENKLIDITAENAKYDIVASGSDWTIRNIGVEGRFEGDAKSSPLRVRVTDADGEGLIEHVYLGDGGGEGRTGLFVLADHAGMLRVRRLNVQHWGDNGVYGSAPGNHENHGNPGEDGIVRIFDSFANDNGSGGFRIGTDGSFCKNCVSINARQFAFWGYYDNTKFIDCHAANAASASYAGNARYWIERGTECGSIELINSRHSGSRAFALECEKIGEPKSNPRTKPPTGVPTSPEEAARGCATD